jgi:hypothetical protein
LMYGCLFITTYWDDPRTPQPGSSVERVNMIPNEEDRNESIFIFFMAGLYRSQRLTTNLTDASTFM